jgi:NAD(P)-dependent dehydrogenase (short-subunit alcohol dehydrogenase family)
MTDGDGPTGAASLAGRTMLMSGGSRGIGLAIATAAARQGANVVLLAKTDQPHPKLPGTVHTAKAEIEAAGGRAVAVIGDVRREEDVDRAVATAADAFGGIDIVVNNASAISLAHSDELTLKQFDLMQSINVRGTWLLTTRALPHLRRAGRAHVLTLSPPLNLSDHWLGVHPGYTLSKFGMTLLTRSWASEFSGTSVSFSSLWPETLIATAAVHNVVGGGDRARSPQIMADAAVAIFAMAPGQASGRCFLDTEVLAAAGVADLAGYGGSAEPSLDIYVDAPYIPRSS